MAVKKAVGGTKTNALAKWDEALAKYAKGSKAQQQTAGTTGNLIGIRAGIMTYKGEKVDGGKMNVVITDDIFVNAYYADKFDSDNPRSPDCYAMGRDAKALAPTDEVTKKQSETCDVCRWNQYGTADTGKGKACKNMRRIAIIPEGALKADIATADTAYLQVPPTSSGPIGKYIGDLNDSFNRPAFSVVTEIKVEPDEAVQVKVSMSLKYQIEDGDQIGELIEKHERETKDIMWAWPKNVDPPPGAAKSKSGGGKAPAKQPAKFTRAGRK